MKHIKPTTLLMCRLCAITRAIMRPHERKQYAEDLKVVRSACPSPAAALAYASANWPDGGEE